MNVKATICRGLPWGVQATYQRTSHNDPGGLWSTTETSFTVSDFRERNFYRWEVTFPEPFNEFCSKSCLGFDEAVHYANETVRKLRTP